MCLREQRWANLGQVSLLNINRCKKGSSALVEGIKDMFSDVFSGEGIFEQIVFATPNCMIRSVLFALGNDS